MSVCVPVSLMAGVSEEDLMSSSSDSVTFSELAAGSDSTPACALVSGPQGILASESAVPPLPPPATEPLLPPQVGPRRKTLVLDLDQTLIECLHVWFEGAHAPDFIYTDSEGCMAKVWLRPHLHAFLEECARHFEVVLFTAAAQRHADAVLAHVDPTGCLVQHRLYGHHTVPTPSWSWVKDLSRLGRDLSQTLIVDDCAGAALLQPANWLSIRPFSQADVQWDTALLEVLQFLLYKVLPADDVRTALAELHLQQHLQHVMVQASLAAGAAGYVLADAQQGGGAGSEAEVAMAGQIVSQILRAGAGEAGGTAANAATADMAMAMSAEGDAAAAASLVA
ncbi:hypothetical protein FOA52_005643 [Chlamydomonas sp. UWO 241]|nr:hypothetical protein FOA52_005643 [Chlamydomonas sp. UWO 241]